VRRAGRLLPEEGLAGLLDLLGDILGGLLGGLGAPAA